MLLQKLSHLILYNLDYMRSKSGWKTSVIPPFILANHTQVQLPSTCIKICHVQRQIVWCDVIELDGDLKEKILKLVYRKGLHMVMGYHATMRKLYGPARILQF